MTRPKGGGHPTAGRGVIYPMSPHDLAAHDRLDRLIAAGVSALKIEGRLKPAEYVAGVTRFYRAKIDAVSSGEWSVVSCQLSVVGGRRRPRGRPEIHPSVLDLISVLNPRSPNPNPSAADLAFSRGFCRGWLDGRDDQALVSGQVSRNAACTLGQIEKAARPAGRRPPGGRRSGAATAWCSRATAAGARKSAGGSTKCFGTAGRSKGRSPRGWWSLPSGYGTIAPASALGRPETLEDRRAPAPPSAAKTYAAGRYGRRVPVDIVVEAAVGRPLVVLAAAATGAASRV